MPPTLEAFCPHRETLNRKLRAAYLAGVEQLSPWSVGRGLTEEELLEATAEYPGDLPTVR